MRDLLRRHKGSTASACALGFRIVVMCFLAIQVTACGGGGGGGGDGGATNNATGGAARASISSVSTAGSLIVDNSTAGFSTAGNWPSSTGIGGYYGKNYQYSSPGDGSSKAKWKFDIATSGTYDVDAWWTAAGSRATDAPYTLYNNGIVVATVTKNQRTNGGQFNSLGSYSLSAGTLVVVLDNNASGYLVADAVRVTGSGTTTSSSTTSTNTTSSSTTSSSTTSGIVDNSTAGFSTAGNWPSSTGIAGYYGKNYQYSSPGDGSSKASWKFDIATSGTYVVDAWWAAAGSRAADAPYTLYNNGIVVATVTKNQQINGGQFNSLGSYSLSAGTLVVVLGNDASGYVVADAVRVTGSGAASGGATGTTTTSSGTTSSSTTSGGTTTSGTSGTTGSITLRWTPPVTRADGTPLSLAEIDGYRVHYGKSAGNYTNQVNVPDGTAQSVTVTGVSLGVTYYIVMSTYDVDGRESGYSKVISKSGN